MHSPYEVRHLLGLASFPVYVLAGGRDPLLAGSISFVRSLRRRGGKVALDIAADGEHGFLHAKLRGRTRQPSLAKVSRWIETIR